MVNYEYFLKKDISENSFSESDNYDLFISAFNDSERVKFVYNHVKSNNKFWVLMPEYNYLDGGTPTEEHIILQNDSVDSQIRTLFSSIKGVDYKSSKMLIDITGFMRPQLCFLLLFLYKQGVKKFDLIYSEPQQYLKNEDTNFSDGKVYEVKQIPGFMGSMSREQSNDILIIGSGYDYNLIKSVCNSKSHIKEKMQMIGFPSLRPDMYQENLLKACNAADDLGSDTFDEPLFAPANDPFITASVLSHAVSELGEYSNLYLSPLSTKPQTVGFALFYILELLEKPASLIFPYFESYSKETTKGFNNAWIYSIEF